MATLWAWLAVPRYIFFWIDTILFSLVDNVYDIFITVANKEIIDKAALSSVMHNAYILVSTIAFFRLAVLLVNSIIDPDKLYEKGKGLASLFGRVCIMIGAIVVAPFAFDIAKDIQVEIIDSNIINKLILNNQSKDMQKHWGVEGAAKTFQKTIVTTLIKPEESYFSEGQDGIDKYLKDTEDSVSSYVNSDCNNKCKNAMKAYHKVIEDSDKHLNLAFTGLNAYIGSSDEIKIDGEKTTVYFYEYIALVTSITLGFLIYVIISWTIDIAIRSVELAVLELISPLFMATIVDPKSTQKGGYFNNWLMRYGKTYADLFLKLAIIAISILLLSVVQDAV